MTMLLLSQLSKTTINHQNRNSCSNKLQLHLKNAQNFRHCLVTSRGSNKEPSFDCIVNHSAAIDKIPMVRESNSVVLARKSYSQTKETKL